MSWDRSHPSHDESRYNERIIPSPWPITDKTHECITRREAILLVDNGKIQLLLCLEDSNKNIIQMISSTTTNIFTNSFCFALLL
ncbi:unnamed protein product [Rotaria socialis]